MGSLPERTCVACRQKAPCTGLVRVTVASDGPRVDRTGAAQGRGAWLHRDAECIRGAVRPGVLARALRSDLSQDELGRLRSDLEEELTHE